MEMLRSLKCLAYSAAALTMLAGCGGGGGDDSVSTLTGTATYVDAAVSGVSYRCGSENGVTDGKGTFRFEKGKGCAFRLGDITLRTVAAGALGDDAVIIETDPQVAALLQSLDENGDPDDGIEIVEAVVETLKKKGVHTVPETEEELADLIKEVAKVHADLKLKPVSYAEAVAHIKETYAKYADSEKSASVRLTDEDAFNQYAAGPVLYSIPVLADELPLEKYGLEPMDDSAFNALSQEEKYTVAMKLYASLFYGTDAERFKHEVDSGSFISRTRALFDRELTPAQVSAVEEKVSLYNGNGDAGLVGQMLARLYEMAPSRAYLNRWAAYILTQTILFSPAYELDTVYTVDAIDVYSDLVRDFDAGFSMQWVTFQHMMTDENWRRFRSPEDNGREMLEIYTMDFEDAHVPLAGKALQNWRLDRRSNTLVVDLNENSEPITDLFVGRVVFNGTDFYSALVLQPAFVPTVTRRLVDIYFPDFDEGRKESVVRRIVSSRPMRFTDILKQIVFSKEYLLHSHKTRSFEESFFHVAKTLHWLPKRNSFYYIARNLDAMHQSTMRYKLGRKVEVPLDSQSFAWYHKTIRENVMLNYERNASWESNDDGWDFEMFAQIPENLIASDELDDRNRRQESWYRNERVRAEWLVNQLFVPLVGREATPEEVDALFALIDDERYDPNAFDNLRSWDLYGNSDERYDVIERANFTQLVLNYLSRLHTIYEFEAVK